MAAAFKRGSTLVGQLEKLLSRIARIRRSSHQMLPLQLGDYQPHALMFDVTMRSHRTYAGGAMTVKQTQGFRLCRGRGVRSTAHFPDKIADHSSQIFGQLFSCLLREHRVTAGRF
jgi:hypothetical protein